MPLPLPDAFYSDDPRVRVRALHGVCPCIHGFEPYESYMSEVRRLQKDADPEVRAVALHVERDALSIHEMCDLLDRDRQFADEDFTRRFKKMYAL